MAWGWNSTPSICALTGCPEKFWLNVRRNLRRTADRLAYSLQLLSEPLAECDSLLFAGNFHVLEITNLGSN